MIQLKKSLILLCLAGAIVLAPFNQANARHYYRDTLVVAAVGGAVAGLVGGVVGALSPASTVVVDQPVYVEPEPVIVTPVVVQHRPHRYYRPVRYIRHHYRYY